MIDPETEALCVHPRFFPAMRQCAWRLNELFLEFPHLGSIFASRQRWMLAQLAFAIHHGRDPADPSSGLCMSRFVRIATERDIASRNTASAFLREMLTYRYAQLMAAGPDKRVRPIEPTEAAYDAMRRWLQTHLGILDEIDGGRRMEALPAGSPLLDQIQPKIAYGIIARIGMRPLDDTVGMFSWANSGGAVMDYLVGRIVDHDAAMERIPIGPVSLTEIRKRFRISQAHLKRLMARAQELGSIGTESRDGQPASLWLSQGFIRQYSLQQAEKFLIIDRAISAVLGAHPSLAATVPAVASVAKRSA